MGSKDPKWDQTKLGRSTFSAAFKFEIESLFHFRILFAWSQLVLDPPTIQIKIKYVVYCQRMRWTYILGVTLLNIIYVAFVKVFYVPFHFSKFILIKLTVYQIILNKDVLIQKIDRL